MAEGETVGYFLNSVIVKSENDFEKMESLYHRMAYEGYESLKRKKSGKIYDTVAVKYFPNESDFCIYDESNNGILDTAKNLSCEIASPVISIQIFDSDELEINAFVEGKKIARIHKTHSECEMEGRISCIHDEEKCKDILKEDYTFMEDCAEKIFSTQIIFPEEKIKNEKIVKYHKEIIVSLETEKLPAFDFYGYCPPMQNTNEFSVNIINRGKKSKGISVIITGKSIENKIIDIKKVSAEIWKNDNEKKYSSCDDPEKKEANGKTFLIYRLNDFEFPNGYNKEILDKMFRTNNMSLYQKALDLQYESVIKILFEYELTELKDELQIFIYPNENFSDGGAAVTMELGEYKSWGGGEASDDEGFEEI